jgi:hypothetical protein
MSAPELRVPPTRTDAEQDLLGACMINNSLLDYAEILQPAFFANGLHARF